MSLIEWPAYKRIPIEVVSAQGSDLVTRAGDHVLDLYGGHCVNTLGAGDPGLGAVLARQWKTWSFATNLIDHAPRREFLAAFEPTLPRGDWSVFVTNSGAEANENALKAALAITARNKVVCFSGAFHGRTAGAALISDTKRAAYPAAAFEAVRIPWSDIGAASRAIDSSTAAVILEPIQSLAGVQEPAPGFLAKLRERCDQSGALLIFDEVQSGNGRLGTFWASQHFDVIPDLFTTAKGAGGGFPIGLTVARASLSKVTPEGLMGTTFGGGPLALAMASEVSRRIAAPGFLEHVRRVGADFRSSCAVGPIASIRGEGLLLGLVLHPGLKAVTVRDRLLEQGILVGTCDDPSVLRLSPALNLPSDAPARLAAALERISADPRGAGAARDPVPSGARP
ncbi:MAG TPA: aminotransferase class III-fold pyridoxal phosphate-dependent enzyme [Planctomycetota bacterium]|nr:aminotransferase class III-fold pyridoxal phosphate-dependent enzyme [Planctomycetota bacterium]